MAIPDFQTLMRPILELHDNGRDVAASDIVAAMAEQFSLDPVERMQLLESGRQTVIGNRVAWAVTHMAQARLLIRPSRGVTRITERGRGVLAEHLKRIDMKVLARFAEYQEFRSRRAKLAEPSSMTDSPPADTPPQEAIPQLVAEAHAALAADLIDRLRKEPPEFLERCVLDLLVKMGYGGPEGAVSHIGGPGDAGLDGLVRQDALGLDVVYVQAKRYSADHVVQRSDVQAFVGALQGAQADRGIFITTSRFSVGALQYAKAVAMRIILIDSDRLGGLMVEHGCGVRASATIVLKEIDEEFFEAF